MTVRKSTEDQMNREAIKIWQEVMVRRRLNSRNGIPRTPVPLWYDKPLTFFFDETKPLSFPFQRDAMDPGPSVPSRLFVYKSSRSAIMSV